MESGFLLTLHFPQNIQIKIQIYIFIKRRNVSTTNSKIFMNFIEILKL
jgi:hypothetical protein